jgi:hypothetical protein
MKKDLNDIAAIEKAIKEKYGDEAIQNPKKHWDKEKEEKYLKDLKDFYSKKASKKKTTESNGFLLKEKRNSNETDRKCPVCGVYSFLPKDDLYMNKFQCCFKCYIQYVEDREERWKTGWRPNN